MDNIFNKLEKHKAINQQTQWILSLCEEREQPSPVASTCKLLLDQEPFPLLNLIVLYMCVTPPNRIIRIQI